MKLKLSYFDFNGGRGEAARLALFYGGIEFEDNRISMPRWTEIRKDALFHAMPELEVDGRRLTQSNTINRFVGKLAGLYPKEPWPATQCDEVMDAVEHIVHQVVATFGLEGAVLKAARQRLTEGPLPLYLRGIGSWLDGRSYFAGDGLSVADLKVLVWVRSLLKGHLDHIPTSIVGEHAPNLLAHEERISQEPKVAEYYRTRGG